MKDLCGICKTFTEIVYVEEGTERPFCEPCVMAEPLTKDELQFLLLMLPGSPWGPPFKEGDVVEARCAGVIFDGVGTVHEMDMSFAHGGTPLYPTWRVVLETKAHDKAPDEGWYTENCLTLVKETEGAK
jgi:hypothetical protein